MQIKNVLYLLVLVFTSCTTMRTTNLSILMPAEVTFPLEMKSAVLVNNAPNQPATIGHTSVLKQLYRNRNQDKVFKKDSVELDSLGFAVVYNAFNGIQGASFFDTVSVFAESLGSKRPFYDTNQLPWDKVVTIAKQNQADVVISLDAFMYKSTVTIREYYKGWREDPTLDVSYEALWRVYDPVELKVIEKLLVRDTVFWSGEMKGATVLSLPKRTEAVSEAAWIAGGHSAKKIVPFSESVERFYYNSGNRFFRSGHYYYEKGEFQKAGERWEYLYKVSKKELVRSRAALNLAFYYETINDLESATLWVKKAIANYPRLTEFNRYEYTLIKQYSVVLDKRVKDIKKIEEQILGI